MLCLVTLLGITTYESVRSGSSYAYAYDKSGCLPLSLGRLTGTPSGPISGSLAVYSYTHHFLFMF